MKVKLLFFVLLLVFSFAGSLFSQDEDLDAIEADLREHFTIIGDELRDQHEELSDLAREHELHLNEVEANEDEFLIGMMEIEHAQAQQNLASWAKLIARHKKLMSMEGEAFIHESEMFNAVTESVHRERDLIESRSKVARIKFELGFAEDEQREDEQAILLRFLKQAQQEVQARSALMERWEAIARAEAQGHHEEAEVMHRKLFLEEQDLSLKLEAAELQSRVIEGRDRAKQFRKEAMLADKEVQTAKGISQLFNQRMETWKQLRAELEQAEDEEREELMEQFFEAQEKFQLKREAMEIELDLVRAQAHGDDDMVEELELHLEELSLEIHEFEEK